MVSRKQEMADIPLASVYRLNAISFRMSAEVLQKDFISKGENIQGNVRAQVFYYLVSHSIELLLKCALVKRRVTDSFLRQAYLRHNLENLLKELESENFRITELTRDMIRFLNNQHSKHVLRYTVLLGNGDCVNNPKPEDIFIALDELLLKTRLRGN